MQQFKGNGDRGTLDMAPPFSDVSLGCGNEATFDAIGGSWQRSGLPAPYNVPVASSLTVSSATASQSDGTVIASPLGAWNFPGNSDPVGSTSGIQLGGRDNTTSWVRWDASLGSVAADAIAGVRNELGYTSQSQFQRSARSNGPSAEPGNMPAPELATSVSCCAAGAGADVPPRYLNIGTQMYGGRCGFTPPTGRDYAELQWCSMAEVSAPTYYATSRPDPSTGAVSGGTVPASATFFDYYASALYPAQLYIRTQNVGGVWSVWTYTGINLDSSAYLGLADRR